MSPIAKNSPVFYLVETSTGEVLEVRKRMPSSRFLVEFFPSGFKWVTEEEFYSTPSGTHLETRIMSPTSRPL